MQVFGIAETVSAGSSSFFTPELACSGREIPCTSIHTVDIELGIPLFAGVRAFGSSNGNPLFGGGGGDARLRITLFEADGRTPVEILDPSPEPGTAAMFLLAGAAATALRYGRRAIRP